MSDSLQHECGVAFVRFRKPFAYYVQRYGSLRYCMERLYLLMHKQYNRGQDGAGIAAVKIDLPPGRPYMHRCVSTKPQAIEDIFKPIFAHPNLQTQLPTGCHTAQAQNELATHIPWLGQVMVGHLRYGTYGGNAEANCHPFVRSNNWRVRNIALAGNFNMTNNDVLFDLLLSLGQHPVAGSDMAMVMEKIGHFLDEEVQRLYQRYKKTNSKQVISTHIENELSIHTILRKACRDFDGGYVLVGILGHGASFIARDKLGIRPAYYYANDEVIVVASERPPIKTAFSATYAEIQPIPPAHALIVHSDGSYEITPYMRAGAQRSCVFERIYFSRAADPAIYQERKQLGRLLAPRVCKLLGENLSRSIFSYTPNTSEIAFLGLIEALENNFPKNPSRIRIEKLISKDVKLRTFITNDDDRKFLATNVYDTAYELRPGEDILVIVDDSIVRGTTLRQSILTLLATLGPKEIVVVSAAPQVRYPDCYGIDMSNLQDFVAFEASLALLKEKNQHDFLEQLRIQCENSLQTEGNVPNYLQQFYAPCEEIELSNKIAQIIQPKDFQPHVRVLYLPIKDLRSACPQHRGDWYFTGNYPTAGGNRMANRALLHALQGINTRAY